MFPLVENPRPHASHLKGRSFVCDLQCNLSTIFKNKSNIKIVPPPSRKDTVMLRVQPLGHSPPRIHMVPQIGWK